MRTKIWIALSLIYVLWGSTYLAIRFAVQTIPPFLMAGTRFLIAGLLMFLWRWAAGDPLPTARQWRSTAIIGVLLLLGGNGMVSWAEQKVPSGIAALVIGAVPLFMAVIEALRPGGARPGWLSTLGILIGFGGIALLVGPDELSGGASRLDPAGVGALLLASLLWSLGSVYGKTADLPGSSLMGTGAEMLSGSAALYLVGTLSGEWQRLDLAAITAPSWIGLAYLTLFGSMIAFGAYAWLLRNAPISLVSTYAYVNPVAAIFLGALVAGETLDGRVLIAALIIIGSVVLINTSKHPGSSREDEQVAAPAD